MSKWIEDWKKDHESKIAFNANVPTDFVSQHYREFSDYEYNVFSIWRKHENAKNFMKELTDLTGYSFTDRHVTLDKKQSSGWWEEYTNEKVKILAMPHNEFMIEYKDKEEWKRTIYRMRCVKGDGSGNEGLIDVQKPYTIYHIVDQTTPGEKKQQHEGEVDLKSKGESK